MDKLITVIGPTACGKSELGIFLAKKFNGEIISCDSRQVYKELDIGTGKVSAEQQRDVAHHLLDVKKFNEKFSLAEYQKLAYNAINDVLARKKTPFLVGGTGLYSRAVTEGYVFSDEAEDKLLRAEINAADKKEIIGRLIAAGEEAPADLSVRHLQRRLEKTLKGAEKIPNTPRYEVMQLILAFPRETLYRRIEERLDRRLKQGMVDEVRGLIARGATEDFLFNLGLEYRYTLKFIKGEYSDNEYRTELLKQIRHFAKRQITWYKKEKNAITLDTSGDYYAEAENKCRDFLIGSAIDGYGGGKISE